MDSCQLLSSSASDPVLCSLPITSSEPYRQFGRISTWKPRLCESESVCLCMCLHGKVTYTIIQSITSSEMCSLYLTHPCAHTLGAVGTVHSAVDAQEML